MENINIQIEDLVILCQQIKEVDSLIVLSKDAKIKQEYFTLMKELMNKYSEQTGKLKIALDRHFEENKDCINFTYKKLYRSLYS